MAFTSLSTLMQQSSHADVPVYGQESPGFGSRRTTYYAYTDSIAFDTSGDFFMGNYSGNNSYIRKFTASGAFIKDFNVSDTTGNTLLSYNAQYGRLAMDNSNNLYAIDVSHKAIHVFDSNGVFQTSIANPILTTTTDIIFDHSNNYYLTDPANQRVQKYAHDGTLLYSVGGPTAGSADGQFNTPGEVAVDSHNNLIVTDINNHRIQMFDATGTFIRKFGQANAALYCPVQPSLDGMAGLTVDQQDNIYVATHAFLCSNNVQKFDNTGTYLTTQIRPRSTMYMRTSPANIIYSISSGVVSQQATDGTTIGDQIVGNPNTLMSPTAAAQDSLGNTYIVDYANTRIQKFDVNHNPVLTFGSYGGGNGKFQSIGGIAIDKNDVIYVTDEAGKNVQTFNTGGSFIAKFGTPGSGPGQFNDRLYKIAIQPNGNLVVQDGIYFAGSRLHIMTPTGGSVADIQIDGIHGFALKSNGDITILASPNNNYRFYTYTADGTALTSYPNYFANPQTSTSFTANNDLAYDSFDNLYANGTDTARAAYVGGGSSVARINLTEPDLPGYTAIANSIDSLDPAISFTSSNQLLVPDSTHNYVRVYTTTGILHLPTAPTNLSATSHQQSTLDVAWQPPTSSDPVVAYRVEYKPHNTVQWLSTGAGVTTTSTTITGLTSGSYDVRVSATTSAGTGTSAQVLGTSVQATYEYTALLTSPTNSNTQGIVFDHTGKRYEANTNTSQIDVYNADGSYDRSFGSAGSAPGQLNMPQNIAISGEDKLYVADTYNNRISIFSLDGTYLTSFGTQGLGDGQFYYPNQVYVDSHDTVYVVSSYNNIQKFDKNGTYLGRVATDLTAPISMVIDANDNMYVANASYDAYHGIVKYDKNGTKLLTIGSAGEADGQFYEVYAMLINPEGNLVVSDTYNYRIQIFSPTGQHLSTIGRGYGYQGAFLTMDGVVAMAQASNGDLYIPNAYSPYTQVLHYLGGSPTVTPPVTPATPPTTTPPAATSSVQPSSTPTKPSPSPTATVQPTPVESTPTPTAEQKPQPASTTVNPKTREITISWPTLKNPTQPPAGYVIEYRPTTAKAWTEAARVSASTQSSHFTVASDGTYFVRVAAFFSNTDQPRIILAVATVDVASLGLFYSGSQTKPTTSLPLWATACIVGLLIATAFLIPIIIRRRKKKQAAQMSATPFSHH